LSIALALFAFAGGVFVPMASAQDVRLPHSTQSATNSRSPKVDTRRLQPLAAHIAEAIDEIAVFDPPRFWLNTFKPLPDPAFILPSNAPGATGSKCERAAAFDIIAYQSAGSTIYVGICEQEARSVRDGAIRVKTLIDEIANGSKGVERAEADLMRTSMNWTHTLRPDGWDAYQFALIIGGHGFSSLHTVILVNRSRDKAVVVQADFDHLCNRDKAQARIATPLCERTREALLQLATSATRLR
jgi:hypothetical protein